MKQEAQRQVEPDPSRTPSVMGVSADTSTKVHLGLWQFGRERAIASGDHRPDPAQMEALRAHARSAAEEQAACLFAPGESRHDAVWEEKYDKARGDRSVFEKGLAAAEEDRRKREDALAGLGSPPSKPRPPWGLLVIAAVVIGLTVAVAVHDFFLS